VLVRPWPAFYSWQVDDHTLRVLEFQKVLALLADEAAFSIGRELSLAVVPETEYAHAFELQARTSEMRLLDQMGIDVPFAGAHDIRQHIHAAGIGQVLEPSDLVEVALRGPPTASSKRCVTGCPGSD